MNQDAWEKMKEAEDHINSLKAELSTWYRIYDYYRAIVDDEHNQRMLEAMRPGKIGGRPTLIL